jgi:hypothetical protein
MFKIEDQPGGYADGTRHRIVDHDQGAQLTRVNGVAQTGGDLFLLKWQELVIPIVTFSQHTVDRESGENEVHVHIRAIGDSRYARNSGLKASMLSKADRFLARRMAAEALLVFGSWYDGLSYQEGHFVVKDATDGDNLSYTLASFGYSGASRPPNYHARLEWTEESIRRQAVEEAWGLDLPDAIFVIVLHNRRRAILSSNQHLKLSVHEVFPNVPTAELEDLEHRADRLAFNASDYGSSHLDGESIDSVLQRMSSNAPGFSRGTYRRNLAYGTIMVQGNRDREKQRREELVESARSADLLNGVFALLHFNRRYSKKQFLGAIPIHQTLGDLHSRAELDEAVGRAGNLLEDASRYGWTPDGTAEHVQRLTTSHPGFSLRCVHDALGWGYERNR